MVGYKMLNLPEKEICDLYCKKIKTTIQLSKQYNCGKTSINRILKKNNIKTYGNQLNLPEKEICDLYIKTFSSSIKIAKQYKCSNPTILNILKKHNCHQKKEEIICNLYLELELSCNDIAKKYKCSVAKISRILNNNNIILRTQQLSLPEKKICQWYNKNKTQKEIGKKYNCSVSVIGRILKKNNIEIKNYEITTSKPEKDLRKYIKGSIKDNLFFNKRNIIYDNKHKKTLELDIYIPDYNLAIEFNGLYWHNELHKDKNYHNNKTNLCNEKGIHLIHVFEDEWKYKQNIVKSIIFNKLGKTPNKIYARKCKVKQPNKTEVKQFLEENHIQGYVGSSVEIGLYYNNDLVSIMTFGKPRFNKKYNWELLRLCTKLNISVIGGASKLFKNFTRNYTGSIISYCDLRYSTGNIYNKLGFNFSHRSDPNYFYTKNVLRESRQKYMKHKLKKIFDDYSDEKTEVQMMNEHGYYRIFDCGNKVWIYNI